LIAKLTGGGHSEIEKALKRLDKVTAEEARMATAQNLMVSHTLDGRVRDLDNKVTKVIAGV
jgi:hypothetical protein